MPYESIFKPELFSDKVIIVTGGGSGIGRCTAHELAALGATVVLTGRRIEKLEKVEREIREDGGEVDVIAFDIRDENAVIASISEILKRHGKIDGLVNNAGGQFPARLEDISNNGWNAVVATNLTGGFLVSREAYRQCMKENGGAIVNIIADMWRSMVEMGHSGAARAGMMSLTETAAVEWGPYGVRVNAVAPGWIMSSGFDTYNDPETRKRFSEMPFFVPLKRIGTEAELSAAIVFLLSPAAGFITGSCIRVDGGVPNTCANIPLPDGESRIEPYEGFHRAVKPNVLGE
jgi:citronellol/citronellal dehydrogenase